MRRRGFSLAEVACAVMLFAMLVMFVLTLVSTSARQTHQTGDRTRAAALVAGISDEVEAAAWQDPGALASTSGRDEALRDATSGVELARFHASAEGAVRTLSTTGTVLEAALAVRWTGEAGRPAALEHERSLPLMTPYLGITDLATRRAALDRRIVRVLFGRDVTLALPELAARVGADLATLRQLGELVSAHQELDELERALATDAGAFEGALARRPAPEREAELALGAGRLQEGRASAYLRFAAHAARVLPRLTTVKRRKLGSASPLGRIDAALRAVERLPGDLDAALALARDHYARAHDGTPGRALPEPVRSRLFWKTFEIARLELSLAESPRTELVVAMLVAFRDHQQSRDPVQARRAARELEALSDLESLRAMVPLVTLRGRPCPLEEAATKVLAQLTQAGAARF